MSPKKKKTDHFDPFPSPRFDPFRRTDRYGARGTAPQPSLEVLRGSVTALALAPLKLSVTLSAVIFFYFVCRFSPVLFRDEQRRARVVALLGRRCARLALLGLGFVSVRYEDVPSAELPPGYPSSPPKDDEDAGDDDEGGASCDEDTRHGGKAATANGGGSTGTDGGSSDQQRRRKSRRTKPSSSSSSPPLAAGAIVSNHCGWIDVLIHMAAPPYRSPKSSSSSSSNPASPSSPQPPPPPPRQLSSPFPSFVARASTEDLPLIGVIARSIGCLYVDRSKAAGASGIAALVRERVAAAAEAGGGRSWRRSGKSKKGSSDSGNSEAVLWPPPLLLFPEGTTTNGRYLLRFKTGAFLAGAPVAPVLLSYGPSPGFQFNPSWESIAAGRHALLLLMQPWLTAVVRRLPAYYPDSSERKDPVLYASRVRDMMLTVGDFAPSDSTIADKWEYQALLQGKPPRPPPPLHQQAAAFVSSSTSQQLLTNGGGGGGGGGGKARRGGGGLSGSSNASVAAAVTARASSGDASAAGLVKQA